MAGVDPYALCPCGSGEKFKWCCHKMESYADRAQRLYETGQNEAALDVLDEGLRKEPANAWLLIRKSLLQIRQEMPEEAKATLRELLRRQPQHIAAQALLVRCVLETEGPLAGIGQLQQALATVSDAERHGLAGMIAITGSLLARIGHYQSALAHLGLARTMTAQDAEADRLSSVENSILSNAGVMPWQKTTFTLSATPTGLNPEGAKRFAEALGWAEKGLWSSAAAAFELLSHELPGAEAERNLGLCRLWLAEDAPASHYLRLAVAKMGNSAEAVDLEALCQLITPAKSADKVEHVQLIWPLRNRDALLATLRDQADIAEDERGPIDPTDPDSPEVDHFILLDRLALPPGDGTNLKVGDLPKILGRVAVGREIVALEGDDDGKLDVLSSRLTGLAGPSIPPAHPKTKVLGTTSRYNLALSWEWYPPEGAGPVQLRRLTDEEQARLIRDVWPGLKLPYLDGRTPRQAAQARDAEVPLRAAFCQFEYQQELSRSPIDMAAMRASLNIPAEPEIDPETVDVEALSFSRFAYVPAERLGDAALLTFFLRSQTVGLNGSIERAAHALAARPEFIASKGLVRAVYTELANFEASRDRYDEAFRKIEVGRKVEPAAHRMANAPAWDMLEIGLKARHETPETWVPELAIVLERYRENQAASQSLMMSLLQMGLIRMAPNPDVPGDYLLDPRALQALMAEYGPRVTTASGQLGVAATKGGIWTPEAASGGQSGGIWTPGSPSQNPGGPDKPKLIIPGR